MSTRCSRGNRMCVLRCAKNQDQGPANRLTAKEPARIMHDPSEATHATNSFARVALGQGRLQELRCELEQVNDVRIAHLSRCAAGTQHRSCVCWVEILVLEEPLYKYDCACGDRGQRMPTVTESQIYSECSATEPQERCRRRIELSFKTSQLREVLVA